MNISTTILLALFSTWPIQCKNFFQFQEYKHPLILHEQDIYIQFNQNNDENIVKNNDENIVKNIDENIVKNIDKNNVKNIDKNNVKNNTTKRTKIKAAHHIDPHDVPLTQIKTNFFDINIETKHLQPFKRRLSVKETQIGVHLLHVLSRIFKKNNINWWLAYGTLLGQQHFYGPIPWDDDFDIKAVGDLKNVFAILTKFCKLNPSYGTSIQKWSRTQSMIKFFRMADPLISNLYQHHFPFIDIFMVRIRRDKLVTPWDKYEEKVKDIFPLQLGIFGGMAFPIPRKPFVLLKNIYFKEFGEWLVCFNGYDHRIEDHTDYTKASFGVVSKFFAVVDLGSKNFVKPSGEVIFKVFSK